MEDLRRLLPGGRDLLAMLGICEGTGLILAVPVLILAAVAGSDRPWTLAGVTWGVLQALTWVWLIRRWSGLVSRLEGGLAGDQQFTLDQEEDLADQPAVRVEVIEDQGRSGVYARLPAGQDQLQALARGVLQQRLTLSDSNWSGRGRLFDRSTWSRLKGELLARGLAGWNSPGCPARGMTLTRSGQAVFRYFLTADHPTLPADVSPDQE